MTIWQFVLYSLIALVVHESGHICVALMNRVPVKKVGVGWKGVYIVRARTTGTPEIFICLAGPYCNVLFALAFCEFHWFALCNLVFASVNLLPFIPGSDGRHAWDALKLPLVCPLCGYTMIVPEDRDWHGLGNCVDICSNCHGSGELFAAKCAICLGRGYREVRP